MTNVIKTYTVNPAWSEHNETTKGSIEEGKLANLVVIDRNPYECDENPSPG